MFLDKIEGVKPSFFPLVASQDPSDNVEFAMESVIQLGVPDVVVLGMGEDGHFASLFPGDRASNAGLKPDETAPVVYTTAPVEPRSRISHSWSFLRRARNIYLHITGEPKLQLIEQSDSRNQPLPIDRVLRDGSVGSVLYWAP
jgi:6-phosphogluconolactonase